MSRPPRTAPALAVAALVVFAGVAPAVAATDAAATGHELDSASLAATTPPAENPTVDAWRVPASVDAANASASTLASYHEPGVRTNVTRDDYLAVAVDGPDLDAAVANQSGNTTERVLAALTDSGRLTIRQTIETTPTGLSLGFLWLNSSNARAVDAPTGDRYVLVVDVDETIGIRDGDLFDGDRSFAAAYDEHVGTSNVLGFFEESWREETRTFAANYRERSDGPVVAESRPVAFVYPSNESATVDAWRVPASVDAANASASELASYENATTGSVNVTPRDRLVVDVTVPGLDARVANVSGNLTERVLDGLHASGYLAVRQTQDTTTPERRAATLWLNASNVRARDAPADDRYLLVVDQTSVLAARVNVPAPEGAIADAFADGDDHYGFESVYDDTFVPDYTARYYANDTERGLASTSRRVRFVPARATVTVDGPLEPGENVTVVGTTTVAPGTDVAVTAGTDAGAIATGIGTVDDRGRFQATLDLALVDAPASLNVSAVLAANRSYTLTDTPATLAVRDPRADVAFDDQRTSTRYVSARANLSHGGVLVLRNDAGVVDATTPLRAGVDQTVTFRLPEDAANTTYRVVAYRIADDGSRGERYANGTASARLTVVPDDPSTTSTTASTTRTTTRTARTTPTTTAATTTEQSTSDDATTPVAEDTIPGFGAALALAALLAVVLVSAFRGRRDDRP